MAEETPPQPRTRQELYDQVRQSSREAVTLREMARMGFWPKGQGIPPIPQALLEKQQALQQELQPLVEQSRKMEDRVRMLKELRKKRMAESRQKRKETKERRERERQARQAAWEQRKTHEILYLGEGVSGGLSQTDDDAQKLQHYQLPRFENAKALAEDMGITVNALRFLAYNRPVSTLTHYQRFTMPKKTGGQRLISAPMPRLKDAQYWVLHHLLQLLPVHEAVHGFCAGRSIVSNARPHVGRQVVLNFDLKDFFPTLTYTRIKGLFCALGYAEAIATPLALLCTEPDTDEVTLDGQTYYVANGERYLPQGAPTSPALTNLICLRLDRRLTGLATKLGFTYTRYADDLTFSADAEGMKHINTLRVMLHRIVEEEGFQVHPDKSRVMRKGSKQEVTGIVVNEKPGVDRATLRRFRALLFQIEKDGIAGKRWGTSPDVVAAIHGYANFVAMVDPEKGKALQERVARIIATVAPHFKKRPRKTYPARSGKWLQTASSEASSSEASTDSGNVNAIPEPPAAKKPWWKFW
ncbi:Reverse transcriptase (RNA-dependent DNA polymerase) [Catalinimonas alkaloidigena]|uniref:RNA-directed DNA polymerase n=1 Tax=Catalinimonas alkaloidigena TaxID=1075417 RepID=A0A1G9GI65_9BACT|nr:reverse transcriptase family protein [Catalinimonas alkaloidigena]SDL00292.1 Reverse transcriptase (RNA-dependent DNA polymerase) [Catalinimonas alkaloidigena]